MELQYNVPAMTSDTTFGDSRKLVGFKENAIILRLSKGDDLLQKKHYSNSLSKRSCNWLA